MKFFRFFIFTLVLTGSNSLLFAQTQTTEALDKKFDGGLSLFFYKNTLRMLNQSGDKDFDEMIKDIEKMKFVMIDKSKQKFSDVDFRNLKRDYQNEEYEEMMTSRLNGRNFNVYIKEKNGSVKGTVILASDSSSLMVLDVLGKVALEKATSLFQTINGSTDIGAKIKSFTEGDSKKKKSQKEEVKID